MTSSNGSSLRLPAIDDATIEQSPSERGPDGQHLAKRATMGALSASISASAQRRSDHVSVSLS
jgi:hypothetical protein